jgi:hypothetical protein
MALPSGRARPNLAEGITPGGPTSDRRTVVMAKQSAVRGGVAKSALIRHIA